MKKTKVERGITLIALIITIIVLLILAVVSIRAIQGDGIIAQAKRARDDYNQAQINEIDKMSEFEALITSQVGGEEIDEYEEDEANAPKGIANIEAAIQTKYGKSIKVGDTITNISVKDKEKSAGTNEVWRVIGITSDGAITVTSQSPSVRSFQFEGVDDALNQKSILNTKCRELYDISTDSNIIKVRSISEGDVFGNLIPDKASDLMATYKYRCNASGQIEYSSDGGTNWRLAGLPAFSDYLNSLTIPGKGSIDLNSRLNADSSYKILEASGYSYCIPFYTYVSDIAMSIIQPALNTDLYAVSIDPWDIECNPSMGNHYVYLAIGYIPSGNRNFSSDTGFNTKILYNCAQDRSVSQTLKVKPVLIIKPDVTFVENGNSAWKIQ